MRITLQPLTGCAVCLFCAFAGERLTLTYLTACLAHEAGHLLAMAILRIPVCGCTVTPGGAVIAGEFSHTAFWQEAVVHLAGITVNGLCAALLLRQNSSAAAAIHLLLAIYNLLPLAGNDGARCLCALSAYAPQQIQMSLLRCLRGLSALVNALFCIFSAWLFWYGTVVPVNAGTRCGTILCGGLLLRTAVRMLSECTSDQKLCSARGVKSDSGISV